WTDLLAWVLAPARARALPVGEPEPRELVRRVARELVRRVARELVRRVARELVRRVARELVRRVARRWRRPPGAPRALIGPKPPARHAASADRALRGRPDG